MMVNEKEGWLLPAFPGPVYEVLKIIVMDPDEIPTPEGFYLAPGVFLCCHLILYSSSLPEILRANVII